MGLQDYIQSTTSFLFRTGDLKHYRLCPLKTSIIITTFIGSSSLCLADSSGSMITRSVDNEESIVLIAPKDAKQDKIKQELSDMFESLKNLDSDETTADTKPDTPNTEEIAQPKNTEPEPEKVAQPKIIEPEPKEEAAALPRNTDKNLGNAFELLEKMAPIAPTTTTPGSNIATPKSTDKNLGDAFEFFEKLEKAKPEIVIKPVKNMVQPEPVNANPVLALPVNVAPSVTDINLQKRGVAGDVLDQNAEQWSCVEDAGNGLVWEVKTVSDKNNTYTWYDPVAGTINGIADGGHCNGKTNCDTHAYVQALNKKNYCGYSDWRLPTLEEMKSLVSYGDSNQKTTIDINYFPHTNPSWYWTSSSNENRPEYAWYVLFRNGIPLNDLKAHSKHIRLVRSGNPVVANN